MERSRDSHRRLIQYTFSFQTDAPPPTQTNTEYTIASVYGFAVIQDYKYLYKLFTQCSRTLNPLYNNVFITFSLVLYRQCLIYRDRWWHFWSKKVLDIWIVHGVRIGAFEAAKCLRQCTTERFLMSSLPGIIISFVRVLMRPSLTKYSAGSS